MVYRQDSPDRAITGFVIKPNQAISWQLLMLVYSGIAIVTLSIGVFFYVMGLPLILPFSGIEVLALGAALYVTARRGEVQEVVSIDKDSIVVESGRLSPENREIFQRAWAKVVLERSWNSWYPDRLMIRSHGKELEIGRFLNEQERQGLALILHDALVKDGHRNNL